MHLLKTLLVLPFCFFFGFEWNDINAQTGQDSIYAIKQVFGNQYIYQERRVTFHQLPDIVKVNEQAKAAMGTAQTHKALSMIIGGAGGFLVGWSLGGALVGNDLNWNLIAAGGGLIVLSIPFEVRANRFALDAVSFYNSGIPYSALYDTEPKLEFGANANGIGLSLRF